METTILLLVFVLFCTTYTVMGGRPRRGWLQISDRLNILTVGVTSPSPTLNWKYTACDHIKTGRRGKQNKMNAHLQFESLRCNFYYQSFSLVY